MKHKFLKIFLPLLALCLVIVGIQFIKPSGGELRSISSDAELYRFYEGSSSSEVGGGPLMQLLTLPFSMHQAFRGTVYYDDYYYAKDLNGWNAGLDIAASPQSEESSSSRNNDYSTTNIQVENVDEADVIKTDGEYMYSLSGTGVVITDVREPEEPVIAARIASPDDSAPEDLILADDVLTIISNDGNYGSSRYSRYYNRANTIVRIYDIKDRTNPRLEKSYTLHEPYYTSRRIGNQLYVISSGHLRAENSKVVLDYEEDYVTKTFAATDVKYLKDVKTSYLTLFSHIDLSNLDADVAIDPYLIDISNAYVSENAFYLLDEKYDYGYYGQDRSFWEGMKHLFGFKGIFGLIEYETGDYDDDSDYGYKTEIYKFDIGEKGDISYGAKTKIAGETINQYSLDEKNGHLRIALHDYNGSYIAIFDEKLNKIGESGRLAKGESMYATRFIGDKAYLVTYKNMDPLFVIDLKDESNPKVLGELKIPGYSVYLHPYDENHLIGIGVSTEEEVRRNSAGRVLWTNTYISGMKLALFDVSDVKNPKEVSKIEIGDSRTTSAILNNPKALLFSKEKQLLAIPVNNYADDFKIEVSSSDDLSDYISRFQGYKNYVSEGYLVYNINLEDGITAKGSIIHEDSQLIRGAYINDNLIAVSEKKLTINDLDTLKPISELKLTNK